MDSYYKGHSPLPERFIHAFRGIADTWRKEPNFKIELLIGLGAVIAMVILPLTNTQRAVLVLIIALVLALEIINSIFERLLDIVHPNFSEEVKMIKDTMAGAVFLGVLASVIIAILIFVEPLGIFDNTFTNTLALFQTNTWVRIAEIITLAGDWKIVLAIAIFSSAILFWQKRYEMASFLLGSVGLGTVLVYLLKFLSARPRPLNADMIDGYSFPSGHAFMVTVSLFALVYILTNRSTKRKYLWLVAAILILVVSSTRMILGVHWVSDVVAGILFAIIWLFFWYGINEKIFMRTMHK